MVSENSFFLMAEGEVVANSALLQSSPQNPPPFLGVICKSSGKVRRFAIGTESKFALYLINLKLDSGVSHASYIEAVKEGEEPINFGPNALLTDYGHGWKLQTVSEQEVPGKDMGAQPMYKKNPTFMVMHNSDHVRVTVGSRDFKHSFDHTKADKIEICELFDVFLKNHILETRWFDSYQKTHHGHFRFSNQ